MPLCLWFVLVQNIYAIFCFGYNDFCYFSSNYNFEINGYNFGKAYVKSYRFMPEKRIIKYSLLPLKLVVMVYVTVTHYHFTSLE